MVYFVYKTIGTGGCGLLVERLCKELLKRSICVNIIFQSVGTSIYKRYKKIGIQLIKVNSWNRKEIVSNLCISTDCYVVTFTLSDFLICNIQDTLIHTLLYAIHYKMLSVGNKEGGALSKLFYQHAKDDIVKLNNNKQLLCMDEQTNEYTKQFYNCGELEIPILRVAIDDVPIIKRNKTNKGLHILTIARAEFPFKGYIFGLLDWFETAGEDYYLTIVSFGRDRKHLEEKIQELSEKSRCRITLIGETDYDQLEQYYQNTDIYVGMGTTVLDASIRGIVSIPVEAYTKELRVNHFFLEDYRKVALDEGNLESFDRLINQYINIDDEERELLSKMSREAVIEHYSTPMIVNDLLNKLSLMGLNTSTLGLEPIRKINDGKKLLRGLQSRLGR